MADDQMILGFKQQITRGQRIFATEDWYSPGITIQIELDPRLDAGANAEQYFQKYHKARDGESYVRNDLSQVEAGLLAMEALRIELSAATELSVLRDIAGRLGIFQETNGAHKAGLASNRPGLAQALRGHG